jgi:hypothetical protein
VDNTRKRRQGGCREGERGATRILNIKPTLRGIYS